MASGKIVGKTTGPSASKYSFWVEWSSTVNEQDKYSLLTATAYLQRNDGYASSVYNHDVPKTSKYIKVDGVRTNSTQKGIDTRNSKKVIIGSVTNQKIYHDEQGYATVNIQAGFPNVVTAYLTGGSLNKDIALDKIDIITTTIDVNVVKIAQEQFTATLTTNENVNGWYYSLDNGSTWITLSEDVGTSLTATISGLLANTTYNIKFKVRKETNGVESVKDFVITTLPIYVTDIIFPDTVYVDVGKYNDISVTVVPENASITKFDITTSNPDIVQVIDGQLFGVSKGTATITLTATDGSGFEKSTDVSVIQRVTGIYTNATEVVVPKDGSIDLQFEYTILPKNADIKDVIITSGDENIVQIVGSTIVAVGDGTTTATITTVDGGYSAEIEIAVLDEDLWYDYSTPIEILNVNDIKNILSNINTIRLILTQKGYLIDDLIEVEAKFGSQFKGDILEILQNIEYNLDIISNNDAKSIYYVEPKTVGEYASNKEDIWRWVQILNEMHDIVTGVYGKWEYLLCNDGYPTINGKKILVRGDMIG